MMSLGIGIGIGMQHSAPAAASGGSVTVLAVAGDDTDCTVQFSAPVASTHNNGLTNWVFPTIAGNQSPVDVFSDGSDTITFLFTDSLVSGTWTLASDDGSIMFAGDSLHYPQTGTL